MASRGFDLRTLALCSGPLRPVLTRLWRGWRRLRVGFPEVEGAPGPIHYNDLFDPADPNHYVRVGRSALAILDEAMEAAGRCLDEARAVLDLGCGYGRVLRHLRARLPEASITACDVNGEAVAFCEHHFGARSRLVGRDPAALAGRETYDLVWAGSLLPHLPPAGARALLETLSGLVEPGGVAVVTTLGPGALARRDAYPVHLPPSAALRGALEEEGIFFAPYPWEREYGIAFMTRAFVEEASAGGLRLLFAHDEGWDDHQDVYAFIAESPSRA